MKQLREHWSWPTAVAPLVFGVALTLVIASCGRESSPTSPSATGGPGVSAETGTDANTDGPATGPATDANPDADSTAEWGRLHARLLEAGTALRFMDCPIYA